LFPKNVEIISQQCEKLDRASTLGSTNLTTQEIFEAPQVCLSFLKYFFQKFINPQEIYFRFTGRICEGIIL